MIEIDLNQVERRMSNSRSSMPSGLIDKLSRDQIADLFAFLLAPAEEKLAAIEQPFRR